MDTPAAPLTAASPEVGISFEELQQLYTVGQQLTASTSPEDLLVNLLKALPDGTNATANLFFVDTDSHGAPEWLEQAALVVPGFTPYNAMNGMRYFIPDFPIGEFTTSNPNNVLFIEDSSLPHPIMDDATRAVFQQYNARGVVVLPLAQTERGWVGSVSVFWADAHPFTAQEERLYTQLRPLLSSVVLNLRQARDLRKSESQYRQILDSIEDFVIVKGHGSKIMWANRSFRDYSGMTEEELQGIHDSAIAEADQAEQYVQDDAKVFDTGKPLNVEEPIKHPDGTTKMFDTMKTPIFNEKGEVSMVVAVARDMTERKAAEAEREKLIRDLQAARRIAEENSRLKSEFLSMMSHELRTPLNAIEGFTSIMLSKMGGAEYNDKTERYITRVNTNSKRLLALINDFLDLSRIESGRLELANQAFSPAKLAQSWRDEIGVLADRKGLIFDVSIDPRLPETVYGDEEATSKIAINLLGNAIKFTETGAVTLTLEYAETEWRFIVTDSGIGIPPHAREYIFDEFRQVDQSSKRKFGGTGLGLAIAQKLARSMGGTITLASELGQGSTFTVTLPLKTDQ